MNTKNKVFLHPLIQLITLIFKPIIVLVLLVNTVFAADYDDVNIEVIPAAGNVYMLKGAGGNIGVLATDDGLLLVDDQFSPLSKKIEAAMKGIVDKELKFIVNTHFHGDHTGGNHYFSHKAPIFAHQNVRTRLKSNNKTNTEKSPTPLPVVTYQDGINIFLQNEQIQLTHLPKGHTDGDTIVYFKEANVLHTGDLYFELGFPYIDLKNGGTVQGYLSNVHYMLDHFPDDVVIIPGHGKLANKTELKKFADMLEYSVDLVTSAIAQGKSDADILKEGVDAAHKKWAWSFITEERWLKTLIKDLKAH